MNTETNHMSGLRSTLMETLRHLGTLGRNGAALDIEQVKAQVQIANAMKGVADTLVDTARVEVDYLKATHQDRATFLEEPAGLPAPNATPQAHNPFPVTARHRLEG